MHKLTGCSYQEVCIIFFLYISCIIIFIYISIFLSFLIFENFLSFQFVMYSYFNSEKVEYRGVFRNQLNIYDGAF